MTEYKTRSIRIPDYLDSAIQQRAAADNISANKVMERAIAEHTGHIGPGEEEVWVRFTMSPTTVENIDELAASIDRTRGWVIEQACKVYLGRYTGLKPADWGPMEESGSCGHTYQLELVFNYPAMSYADGAVYAMREALIDQVAGMGGRDICTQLRSLASLEHPDSAKLEYEDYVNGRGYYADPPETPTGREVVELPRVEITLDYDFTETPACTPEQCAEGCAGGHDWPQMNHWTGYVLADTCRHGRPECECEHAVDLRAGRHPDYEYCGCKDSSQHYKAIKSEKKTCTCIPSQGEGCSCCCC